MDSHYALLGGAPAFNEMVPVGQLYFPSWERYETAMRDIFNRRYYTNQGPLVRQFEAELQQYLNVKHVICVVNATIGLMMAAEALGLKGKVILPSFTFLASAQSLQWVGIEPVFCDVDPETHQMDVGHLETLIDDDVSGIMGVNLWGGACDVQALQAVATRHGIALYFDSAHAFGCEVNGKKIGGFGDMEVFSFHATKVLSTTEGGCICTNDDELAARLRNIRSSYGAGNPVSVVKTSNGRMSEAQGAIGLLNLEDFEANRQKNESLFQVYQRELEGVSGIKVVKAAGVSRSNHQYMVCQIDDDVFGLTRDELVKVLAAENINARRYFYPGTHRSIGFLDNPSGAPGKLPVTEHLCQNCIQLPIGALVEEDMVVRVCGLIRGIQACKDQLKSAVVGL